MTVEDIINIASATSNYNFHGHTQFCDGHADMEAFIKACMDAGISHYGFSPHSPIPFASSCNMERDAVTKYSAEIQRLRSKYGDSINIYMGMEVDYIDGSWGPSCEYI